MVGQRSSVKSYFGVTEAMLIRDDKCITREELEEIFENTEEHYYFSGDEVPVVEFHEKSVEEVETLLASMGW